MEWSSIVAGLLLTTLVVQIGVLMVLGPVAVNRARHDRTGRVLTLAFGSLIASLATGLVVALVQQLLQVRTVPERVLEATLLVIPPTLFEAGLQRYGFDAKRYAFAATVTLTLVLLTALGFLALWRRWSTWAIVALSLALWLVLMLVLLPLTGAGFFGIELVNGTRAAIGGHLAVALAYAASLAAVSTYVNRITGRSPTKRMRHGAPTAGRQTVVAADALPQPSSRRSALILAAAATTSLFGTMGVVRWSPRSNVTRVVVLDPEASNPEIPAATPGRTPAPAIQSTPDLMPAPAASEAPSPAPTAPALVAADSTPTPIAQPLATPMPVATQVLEPPPGRQLARDKDGLVLPSGRRPGELAELTTTNDNFYIVSKNPTGDPFLQLPEWHLRVDGAVQRPIEIDYGSLRNITPIEVTKTLECISNLVTKCELAPFGCDLISTARWKGARLRDILALAGELRREVSTVVVVAADDFTTTLPIDAVLDPDTLLVYEMNGQPLPREHGYPARVLVPGRYGMKNAKWVVALRPMIRDFDDWYGQRSWSKQAIVKTMTRIDTPRPNAELPPGQHRIAGIAYAGDRGVQQVEYSTDGGDQWHVAELIERLPERDVWMRWSGELTLAPGATLTLMARATDGTGALQIEPFSLPQPDGSSGWHSIEVRATTV
jgi:DMSO/TMAO reductase YedYZ molybdopterin-dependent catalytic subunit